MVVAWLAFRLQRISRKDNRLIVLCYHGIRKEQAELFTRQIRFCRQPFEHDCHVRNVILTFDDAFANLLDYAVPILEQFRIPAIIFAVTGNLGKRPCWNMPKGHPERNEMTMAEDQLLAVSKNPLIQIGSHTMTHPNLTVICQDQLRFELVESKKKLESIVGYSIDSLALPHGAYNDQVLEEAVKAGYSKIYTLDPRPYDASSEDPRIGRFSMSPDTWKTEFVLTCAGAYSWLYPWRRMIRKIRQFFFTADNT